MGMFDVPLFGILLGREAGNIVLIMLRFCTVTVNRRAEENYKSEEEFKISTKFYLFVIYKYTCAEIRKFLQNPSLELKDILTLHMSNLG